MLDTTNIPADIDNPMDATNRAQAAYAAAGARVTEATAKVARTRKRLYYIIGGTVLVGAAAAAAYYFIPGLRGTVAAAAGTTAAAAADVVGETVAETIG